MLRNWCLEIGLNITKEVERQAEPFFVMTNEKIRFVTGQLYFVKEEFFQRFSSNSSISMPVKNNTSNGGRSNTGRPHICISVPDPNRPLQTLIWLVPISSKVEKYETEIAKQRLKYGRCDKIQIVTVMGDKRAALIQNMIPCTPQYISGIYKDHHGKPVELNRYDGVKVIESARRLAVLHKNSPHSGFLFVDVQGIAKALVQDLIREDRLKQLREAEYAEATVSR